MTPEEIIIHENVQLRDRLGRAAYAVRAHTSSQAWEALTNGERAYWCDVGQAVADSLLTENAQLRARILECEDCYDRLEGAFELHLAIMECRQAMSAYAGGYYAVVLGELAERAERAETSRKAWTAIGAKAQADSAALLAELEAARAVVAEATALDGNGTTDAAWGMLWDALRAYGEAAKGYS